MYVDSALTIFLTPSTSMALCDRWFSKHRIENQQKHMFSVKHKNVHYSIQ